MAELRLPSATPEGGLNRYLREIRGFPMLTPEEEVSLAKSWREDGDVEAAHRLVTSHLRLVAKIAMGYRGYGLPIGEIIAEGNVGMMQAVKRFDEERGFRLATYAMWWIRASIQEYVLRSWSLVKIGTTAAQKKLFFNLRKLKARLKAIDDNYLSAEVVSEIANQLNVPEADVVSMNQRLSQHDQSLNVPINGEEGSSWQDWLVDDTAVDQETSYAEREELDMRRGMLNDAVALLNTREQHIFTARRLEDDPQTLEQLSKVYGISRERVRQIEVRAFEKVQKAMKKAVAEIQAASQAMAFLPAGA